MRATTRPTGTMTFRLRPQPDGLAQPQIQGKQTLAAAVIDRGDRLPRNRYGVERAIVRDFDHSAGPRRAGQCGTIVEDRVAVQILPDDDVKGRGGVREDKRTEMKGVGQRDGATDDGAVANIERSATVVLHWIVRVHHKVGRTGATPKEATAAATTASSQIAVGEIERIKTKQRELRSDAHPAVDDHLVLYENPFRAVLINVGVSTERPNGRIVGRVGAWQGRIGVTQEDLMFSA